MNEATLEKLLALTRQVFNGTFRRVDLLTMTPQQKAFIGTAIMLAAGEEYAWRGSTSGSIHVESNYGEHLHNLTQRGLFNTHEVGYDDRPRYWVGSPEKLQDAGRRAGLYGQYKLTPPPELELLIGELGRTPAIEQFLREVEIGRRQERQWQRDWEDHFDREGDALQHIKLLGSNLPPSDSFLSELTVITGKLYGQRGLHDLRDHLNQELDGQ
jgi:hypothetical protein